MKALTMVMLGSLGLCSCGEKPKVSTLPVPLHERPVADPFLEKGRQVWLGTCKVCHLQGLAGSPPLGNVAAWKDRIAKGKDVLFEHAMNGFDSPDGNHMPARGGNPDLSDEEIKAAVEYVMSVSQSN